MVQLMNNDIKRLEEKIAFLEHHVTEQDKVMLEFADELQRLKREFKTITGRIGAGGGVGEVDPMAQDERPPHY